MPIYGIGRDMKSSSRTLSLEPFFELDHLDSEGVEPQPTDSFRILAKYDSDIEYVSGDSGNYLLHGGIHGRTTEIDERVLSSVDALVLESGDRFVTGCSDLWKLSKTEQYKDILEKNERFENSVYLVDCPMDGEYRQRKDWEAGMKTSEAVPIRDAISAEKLENYVAPKLAEEKGWKPTIFVEPGSKHLETFPDYLRSEEARGRKLDESKTDLLEETRVDRIEEFSYDTENAPEDVAILYDSDDNPEFFHQTHAMEAIAEKLAEENKNGFLDRLSQIPSLF